MGPLSRLRAWLGELFGGSDGDDSADEARSAAGESASEGGSDGDATDRLDPNAATETRTRATDDAVDALRDVRQKGSAPGVGAPENADADADEADADAGEPDATDGNLGTDSENTAPDT